ncbi:MAG: hypothetical protein IJJ23_12155 [Clostridia bacterium]|nr:hypothetical protein [Clostridia bacterium]
MAEVLKKVRLCDYGIGSIIAQGDLRFVGCRRQRKDFGKLRTASFPAVSGFTHMLLRGFGCAFLLTSYAFCRIMNLKKYGGGVLR